MIYKRFRVNVFLRVVLLGAAIALFIYALDQQDWFMTTIFSGFGVILVASELIRYVEKTNRDLQAFLLSIKHKDFTNTFTAAKRGKSYAGLRDAFNSIIREFQNLRAEKESHYQYLQTVIEHVGVALVCFDPEEGEVQLMNQAAKELLNKPYLNTIDSLARTNAALHKVIKELNPGEKELVKVVINHELLQLAVQSTVFKLQDQSYKLVSLQNIQSELEGQEIAAWQKLIRVLTHEIMNSVTPIISLTTAIGGMLEEEDGVRKNLDDIDEEDAEDIFNGIRTIRNRTRGMLHFVNAYRNLTRVPKPQFAEVRVCDMVDNVSILLQPEMDKRNIAFEISGIEKGLFIQADAKLIEQVLINLVKNAMEVLENRPHPFIAMNASRTHENRVLIQVQDNGPGIPDEFLSQIFIPFFTTKKKGSGIGLSLSRQIMRAHQGSISVQTDIDEGTTFTLLF